MNDQNPTPPVLPPKDDFSKEPALGKTASITEVFECLLKHPHSLINTIRQNEGPPALAGKLLLLTLGGFIIFGLTLGCFSFNDQLWAAPLKTIMGLIISAVICLPSLYIFTALTGTSLKLPEIATGLAATLALIAALLLGFTPVLWVFSQSTEFEPFFGFLVLLAWLIAVGFGTGVLVKMLKHTETTKTTPLRIWIGIFILVTLQMSTTLRPIIGESDTLFTSEKRFFLEHWGAEMTPDRTSKNKKTDRDASRGDGWEDVSE
ncbi:hypothetical protein N9733_02315 [Akkermansiaceae bacterium]|nr:hypothetical protein [Akkermansiaceae bacterium]